MCALMSAPAVATITITPDDGLYRTYQAWSFTTDPVDPWTDIVADDHYISPGTPVADVSTKSFPPGYWIDALPGGRQGGIWGEAVNLDIWIPNTPDPRLTKIIQAEVTYHVEEYVPGVHGYIDASSYVTAGNDPPYRSISVNDTALADGWRDVTIEWRIPQIYPVEMVHLYLVDAGVAIDRIEVATICVPEPATLLLLGGAAFVGWLRRRRTL